VLIGDGANSAVITALQQIKKGDLVLVDTNNAILTATTAAALPKSETAYVAMGTGPGKFIKSLAIQGPTMEAVASQTYVAPIQQSIALGYNGTDSNFITTPGTEYRLRVHIKDFSRPNWQRPTIMDANYTVPTGGTSIQAALALQSLILAEDSGNSFLKKRIKVEVITDATVAVGIVGSIVSPGSKEVYAPAHGLAKGSYVSIDGGTYQISKLFGTDSFILNAPYQGALGELVSAATAIAVVGIKATGIPVEGFKYIDEYEIINFSAVLTEADDSNPSQAAAPVTDVATMVPGEGYWKQVFDSEMTSRGYLNGEFDRVSYDAKNVESYVVEDTGYGSVIISHNSVHMADFSYRMHSPVQTEIYIPEGGSQGDPGTATNFIAVLNAFTGRFGFVAADLS